MRKRCSGEQRRVAYQDVLFCPSVSFLFCLLEGLERCWAQLKIKAIPFQPETLNPVWEFPVPIPHAATGRRMPKPLEVRVLKPVKP